MLVQDTSFLKNEIMRLKKEKVIRPEIVNVQETIGEDEQKGIKIKKSWQRIFKKHKIDAEIIGLDSLPTFIFKENHKLNKTFITLNFLKKNFLATNSFYVSVSHTDNIINLYLKEFEKIIIKLKNQKNLNKEVGEYLAEDSFKRVN